MLGTLRQNHQHAASMSMTLVIVHPGVLVCDMGQETGPGQPAARRLALERGLTSRGCGPYSSIRLAWVEEKASRDTENHM
jgi:hypothetical protein